MDPQLWNTSSLFPHWARTCVIRYLDGKLPPNLRHNKLQSSLNYFYVRPLLKRAVVIECIDHLFSFLANAA